MKIKNILISQPEQAVEKTPYSDLINKYGITIKFRQFIRVEGLPINTFKKQGVDIMEHTAVVFNSKLGIDNFFCTYDKLRIEVPETIKYFCASEKIANYLQKYITYRKRRFFFPEGEKVAANEEFVKLMVEKNANDRFLLVLSADHHSNLPDLMRKAKCSYSRAFFYKTISRKLEDVNIADYQLLAFFSPFGIRSLFENFPTFEQRNTIIAAMGSTTAKAVADAGLRLDVPVPNLQAQSMPAAIDLYLSAMSINCGY